MLKSLRYAPSAVKVRAQMRPLALARFAGRLCSQCVKYSTGGNFAKESAQSFRERNGIITSKPDHEIYPLMADITDPDVPRMLIPQIIEQYSSVQHTSAPQAAQLQTFGRIKGVRKFGKGLLFIDTEYGGRSIQVVVNSKKALSAFSDLEQETHNVLRPGDSISVKGWPWRTKAGEFSVLASDSVKLVSPSLHPPLDSDAGVSVRRTNRVGELKSFRNTREILMARSTIINSIRGTFLSHDFLEVQTPILSRKKGGASATPFVTDQGYALRIAPELWLKELIIGGFERVFEIGSSFRDEGVDATHNPEFTTCESYMSFSTLEDLKDLTKLIFIGAARAIERGYPRFEAEARRLSQAEWAEIDFITAIESRTGVPLPEDFELTAMQAYLSALSLPTDGDVPKLLDRLAATFIEPHCEIPTFLIHQPAVMAPLAKETNVVINGRERLVSKRFELFIGGKEYVNAYEEQNSPKAQLERLEQVSKLQKSEEIADMGFIKSLEWGLPPTAGWGMGVDRLVMLLTSTPRIQDVLTFRGLADHKMENQK